MELEFASNYSGVPASALQQPNIPWQDANSTTLQYFNSPAFIPSQENYWDVHHAHSHRVEQQRPHSVESYSSISHSSPEPWHQNHQPTSLQQYPQHFNENISAVRKRKYQRKSTVVNRRIKIEPTNDEEARDQRKQANMRERQRTSSLNTAFQTLRGVVPHLPSDKMSKIHTLQITVSYINFLTAVQQGMYSVDQPEIIDYTDSRDKLSCAFQMWRMEEEGKRKLMDESLISERLDPDCC